MTERRKIFTHALTEGITPVYKTRRIVIELGYWEIFGTCDGCIRKHFLSTKGESLRTIVLKISDFDERERVVASKYCVSCADFALNEINREAKRRIDEPELDQELMSQKLKENKSNGE